MELPTNTQDLSRFCSADSYTYPKLPMALQSCEKQEIQPIHQKYQQQYPQQTTFSEDTSIISLLHELLFTAVKKRASDVHFEPHESSCRVRFRMDGILREKTCLPLTLANRLGSRIKILAQADISERRLPQDGSFRLFLDKDKQYLQAVDFRVSICPTVFGEKVVLRILDPNLKALEIPDLGFDMQQQQQFLEALSRPQGLILVTGPTGSGKTRTLYAALGQLNSEKVNIVSLEDPIERIVPGVNQAAVHSKIGLTFTSLMKAFLRQDPDILMVGEIRCKSTAKIACRAAETGHLVLSTLHSNSASETPGRLLHLGASAEPLTLIVAQRLLRRLCPLCKILDCNIVEGEERETYKAKGCAHCTQGYQGRIGIFELMPLSKSLRALISSRAIASEIALQAQKEGMKTLYQSAMAQVKAGTTSVEEILRVCGSPYDIR